MKIKLDENLPARLVPILQQHGHDVDTVPEENLSGRPDAEIWQSVSAESRFLITQDLDFSDTRQFAPGTHAGLLLVRLRERGVHGRIKTVAAYKRPSDADASRWVVDGYFAGPWLPANSERSALPDAVSGTRRGSAERSCGAAIATPQQTD